MHNYKAIMGHQTGGQASPGDGGKFQRSHFRQYEALVFNFLAFSFRLSGPARTNTNLVVLYKSIFLVCSESQVSLAARFRNLDSMYDSLPRSLKTELQVRTKFETDDEELKKRQLVCAFIIANIFETIINLFSHY